METVVTHPKLNCPPPWMLALGLGALALSPVSPRCPQFSLGSSSSKGKVGPERACAGTTPGEQKGRDPDSTSLGESEDRSFSASHSTPPRPMPGQGCAAGGFFLFHPTLNRHLHICVGGGTVPRKLALGGTGQAADKRAEDRVHRNLLAAHGL